MNLFIRSLLVVVAVPAIASADTALTPTPFVTLDQAAGDSAVQVQATVPHFHLPEDVGYEIAAAATVRYVDPDAHLGGYLSIPFSYLSQGTLDDNGHLTSITVFGNAELGGIYALQTSIPSLAVIAHVGVELPTANLWPLATTLRFGVSPILRRGAFFARVDADFAFPLEHKGSSDVPPSMTLAAGVGIQLPAIAFTGEVTKTHLFLSDEEGPIPFVLDDYESATLSARYTAGRVHPYAAVTVPLDETSQQSYNYELTGGVSIALR